MACIYNFNQQKLRKGHVPMRKFKTESKKLLHLMVHSIYTNREIFLRELISNASDSLDKLYMKSLENDDKSIVRGDLEILLKTDKDARTITISDNGIGMTAEELEKNLGTIAHSGSLEFKEGEDAKKLDGIDIIGQFGVGFYSAFMVADKVTVISKAYGSDQANMWESDGVEGYTISEAERDGRGTDVILHLRDDEGEDDYTSFLQDYTIRSLVRRYSDYIHYPIRMDAVISKPKPKPEDAGDDYKTEYEDVVERETLNSMIPIWTKKRSEVTDEEYNEFYKSTFHDNEDPLRIITLHAEGTMEYDALLFIPKKAPYDLYNKDFKSGLALYSSNVMIMEHCEDLLPDCFRFVRGVVDSADLNLNISREMLQHDRQLKAIERRIEKKVKSELADIRDNDRDAYVKFFEEFGPTIKYGIYSTFGAQGDLLNDLLIFDSAKENKMITLDEYNQAAGEDQKHIYYASGDSVERLAKAPSTRAVLDAGYDVLLCSDNIDEFCLMSVREYGEKDLKNVAAGDLDLEDETDKEDAERLNEENKDFFTDMQNVLPEDITKVVAAPFLSDDIASAIVADGPMSIGMEKYMNSLPESQRGDQKPQHILQLNTTHAAYKKLKEAYDGDDIAKAETLIKILYDQALLAEGLPLGDPTEFNQAVLSLME